MKYEYRTLKFILEDLAELNQLAYHGWKVVFVHQQADGFVALLERSLPI